MSSINFHQLQVGGCVLPGAQVMGSWFYTLLLPLSSEVLIHLSSPGNGPNCSTRLVALSALETNQNKTILAKKDSKNKWSRDWKESHQRKKNIQFFFSFYVTGAPDISGQFRTWGCVTSLPEKFAQCLNGLLKSGWKRTQIAWKKFTLPTSNETAMIPKIVIFKDCIFIQSTILYQQSQSE